MPERDERGDGGTAVLTDREEVIYSIQSFMMPLVIATLPWNISIDQPSFYKVKVGPTQFFGVLPFVTQFTHVSRYPGA